MSTLPEAPSTSAKEPIKVATAPAPAPTASQPVQAEEIAFDIKNFSLWYGQRPLRRDRDEDLSVTIGTHGLGNGTFALCYTDATPELACPTAVIEYPAKKKEYQDQQDKLLGRK